MPRRKKETRLLIQDGTGTIYHWTESKAKRPDMRPYDPKNPDVSAAKIIVYDEKYLRFVLRKYKFGQVVQTMRELYGHAGELDFLKDEIKADATVEDFEPAMVAPDDPPDQQTIDTTTKAAVSDGEPADTSPADLLDKLPNLSVDPDTDPLKDLTKKQIVKKAFNELDGAVLDGDLNKSELIVSYRQFEQQVLAMRQFAKGE
jgi:hypothetical protein